MSQKLALKPGDRLTLEERMRRITELRELLEEGYTTISAIVEHFGVTRDTAVNWRNAALVLIAKDPNGFTREGIRNLQTGRIMAKIERLERRLKEKLDLKDELAVHDRLANYYEKLARITGLNTDVQVNLGNPQQLVIIKNKQDEVIHTLPPKPTKVAQSLPTTTDNTTQ